MADERKIIDALFPDDWEEVFIRRQFERFSRSWAEQPTTIRRDRMRYVLRMAAELEEIRKTTRFSTAFCEHAIEAVITGDVADVRLWGIEMLSKKELVKNTNEDDGSRYAAVFEKFRDICEEAVLILDDKTKRERV